MATGAAAGTRAFWKALAEVHAVGYVTGETMRGILAIAVIPVGSNAQTPTSPASMAATGTSGTWMRRRTSAATIPTAPAARTTVASNHSELHFPGSR